jgi:hypothetical protein
MQKNELHVRIVTSKTSSSFLPAGTKRKTKAELEADQLRFVAAKKLCDAGDDSQLRALTDIRYCVECVSSVGGRLFSPEGGRRRKFSVPLFVTPDGTQASYPEVDEHFFVTEEAAIQALKKADQGGSWEIRRTTVATELANKRYLRWASEVKDQLYSEPRRSLDELALIYESGGLPALKALYTRTHALHIVKRLCAELPDRFCKLNDESAQ